MATTTHRNSTASTSNVTSYPTTSFTPVAGELLIAYVHASSTVAATPTMTASANGLTFARHTSTPIFNAATINEQVVFVANQLVPASPVAMTVTFDCTGDAATGAIIQVVGVAGGPLPVGTAAIRQIATQSNASAATTPATTFASNTLTGNPTHSHVANSSATVPTAPTSWTKTTTDQTYSTPLTGSNVAVRDSGFTSTTITWGGTSATVYSTIAVEVIGAGITPAVVSATTSIPTPTVPAGVTVTPSVVNATTSIGVAGLPSVVTPPVVSAVTSVDVPTISSKAVVGGSYVSQPTIGTFTISNTGSPTNVPYPAVVNAGDQLVLSASVQTPSGVGSITAPAGWTLVDDIKANASTPDLVQYIKTAAGTEGGTNLSVAYTSGTPNFGAQILAFGNVSATPQDVAHTIVDGASLSTTTIPGQTLATEGAAQVAAIAQNNTAATATPPTGFTETGDSPGAVRAFEVSYATPLPSGATGDRVANWSTTSRSVGILTALRPNSPGVGTTVVTTIGTPTISTGGTDATATPSVVSATTSFGAVVVTSSAAAAPPVVNAVTTVGTAVVATGETVTASVVAASVTIPTPTITSSVVIAPPVVNAVTTVGTAVVSTGSNVTAAVVNAVTTVGTAVIPIGVTVSPAVLNATTTIPTPTITSRATVAATVVSVVTTIPKPVIPAVPGVVNAVTTIPTPGIKTGETVTASVVSVVTAIPTPVVTTSGNANATPSVVSVVTTFGTAVPHASSTAAPSVVTSLTSVPTPGIKTGSTVPASVLNAVTTVGTPVVTAQRSATATASVVSATTTFGTAAPHGGATASPATVTSLTSIPTPGVKTGSKVTAAVVPAAVSIPTPVVTATSNATATPTTLTSLTSVPTPTITSDATAAPVVISSVTMIGSTTITAEISATASPDTVLAVTTFGGGEVIIITGPPLTLLNPRAVLADNPHGGRIVDNTHTALMVVNIHEGQILMDSIVAGDTAPPFTVQLLDGSTAFDATAATEVRIKIWQDGTLIVNALADTVLANGTVTHEWINGETDEPGPIKSRVVVKSGGDTATFPPRGFMVASISPASP